MHHAVDYQRVSLGLKINGEAAFVKKREKGSALAFLAGPINKS
tara:strand:+ start:56 stop:184 length:129 start_codon:yes stop_codon:yes gene_type:complete